MFFRLSFELENLRIIAHAYSWRLFEKIDNFRTNRKLDQAVVTVCFRKNLFVFIQSVSPATRWFIVVQNDHDPRQRRKFKWIYLNLKFAGRLLYNMSSLDNEQNGMYSQHPVHGRSDRVCFFFVQIDLQRLFGSFFGWKFLSIRLEDVSI